MGTNNYTHIKKYGPFKGLNKGVSDLNLAEEFLSIAKNGFISQGSNALTARTGYKPVVFNPTSTDRRIFAGLYVETDPYTGVSVEKELILNLTGNSASVLEEVTLTIGNSGGVNATAELNITSTGIWQFRILNSSTGAVLYTKDLDSAAGVPSVPLNTLITEVDALADFTMTASPSTAVLTNFASLAIPAFTRFIPSGSSRSLLAYSPRTIVVSTTLLSQFSSVNGPVSYTNMNNVLYFAHPQVGLCKFDGNVITRAGMRPGYSFVSYTEPTATYGYSSAILTGAYVYATAFEVKDAKGNVNEGLGEVPRRQPSGSSGGFWGAPHPGRLGPGTYLRDTAVDPDRPVFVLKGLQGGGEFEARGAIINGNQLVDENNLTITVDSGHTLLTGDTACFYLKINVGGASTFYSVEGDMLIVEALITSVTSTSITLDTNNWVVTHVGMQRNSPSLTWRGVNNTGLASLFTIETDVTATLVSNYRSGSQTNYVIDNTPISNNIKINVYRNKGAGTGDPDYFDDYPVLYLADILVNDCLNSTQTWVDSNSDEILGPLWEQKLNIGPATFLPDYGLSPKCNICHNHKGRIYLAGEPESPNLLYRGDVLYGPEYWDPGFLSSLDMTSSVASNITAIGSTSDSLVVGKRRGIKLISGDLSSEVNIRVDDISFELGLANQTSTVSSIDRCIGLTQLGPIEISSNGQWQFLGSQDLGGKSRLEAVLKNSSLDLFFAAATVNMQKGYYFLYIPNKGSSGTSQASNDSYLQFDQGANLAANTSFGSAYIYSTTQDAWFEWERFDASGGAYIKDGLLHTVRCGDIGSIILRENNSGTLSDQVDWYQAISFDCATNWMTLSEPYMFKQFNRALIQNIERDPLSISDYSLTLTAERDWVKDVAHSSVTINDLDTVGYGQMKMKGNKSRSMRIRLQHSTIKQRPMITGLTVEIAAPFRPKIKQE